ncbi:hypothetical protein KUTeg_009047 [Tegillarca granosa]|uniref:C2H2-type domain-containing protein n=1 Tax=Tegillarca granosa TaxID=220873 RepID=A0ABQ9F7S5_TEGGR|nr:hypothetical protein KUTeg_009047 [Tegillarca granosa]
MSSNNISETSEVDSNNQPIDRSTIINTGPAINQPIDGSTIINTGPAINQPIDGSTIINTSPAMNQPIDGTTIINSSSVINQPIDESTIINTGPVINQPIEIEVAQIRDESAVKIPNMEIESDNQIIQISAAEHNYNEINSQERDFERPKIIRIEEVTESSDLNRTEGNIKGRLVLTELKPALVSDEQNAEIQNGHDNLSSVGNILIKDEQLLEVIQDLPESATQVVLYQCNVCGKYVGCKDELDVHMEDEHNLYRCKICEEEFDNRSDLLLHSREHPKAHKCDICNKTFTRAFHVKRHMKLHENAGSNDANKKTANEKVVHNCEILWKELYLSTQSKITYNVPHGRKKFLL